MIFYPNFMDFLFEFLFAFWLKSSHFQRIFEIKIRHLHFDRNLSKAQQMKTQQCKQPLNTNIAARAGQDSNWDGFGESSVLGKIVRTFLWENWIKVQKSNEKFKNSANLLFDWNDLKKFYRGLEIYFQILIKMTAYILNWVGSKKHKVGKFY